MSLTTWIRSFRSRRKLYPTSSSDRLAFWLVIFMMLLYLIVSLFFGFYAYDWGIYIGGFVYLVYLYINQDPPQDEFVEEYTLVIANIEGIGKQLSELANFLKRERQKVAESEATLTKLRDEKTTLEPMVHAERETVNAILAAHTNAIVSRAWKERALGFMSGLFASLLAGMLFEYLKKKAL